ncbi:nucleoside-diphosphate-sugar epimerase YraR (plasmid) [Cupriavidus necator N-1]|uniref:Nucleoside-diphosphate-sugar epimerase YraR n=1 Tax=Cupriavidus necator (strain ATCC 43291 / DSM 13513 / CCUG 52238 / LMG 8453 / N-1) TaxID=1042878 RepID=F8GX59_CUPNN|nr:NAD(P)H-binding protein [Cupriavidus necator]AEI81929.1 nucleoside-diphosphate-sugar epimerase YraR [Cupriavidus necator N-1]MDX6008251.1 NAD(P)H-binding protein [Cupriavidus necator]
MDTVISMLADQRRVLLSGATGLVGGLMLEVLLADSTVSEVHALSRRALNIRHPKLQVHIVDFRRLPALPPADEVYLALGTTIKVAGSQAAFRAVDLDANLALARGAVAAGVQRVGLVSAVGANAQSSMFYNRVKGELEDALKAMRLNALVMAQPSLLLDNRDGLQQPPRIGEKLAIPIAKLLAPILPGVYRPVRARAVAQALVNTVPTAKGVVVLASDMLDRIGGKLVTETSYR